MTASLNLPLEGKLRELLPNLSRHTALFDAYATAIVFLRILSEQKEKIFTVNDLINLCALRLKKDKSKKEDTTPKQLTLFD